MLAMDTNTALRRALQIAIADRRRAERIEHSLLDSLQAAVANGKLERIEADLLLSAAFNEVYHD